MSISTIKKVLLAGTALVAVSAFGAQAQATTYTLTVGTTTWGEGTGTTGGPSTGAGANGNVVLNNTGAATPFIITNDGTANDGSAANSFNIGSITNSGAVAGSAVTVNSGSAANLSVTISSVGLAASTSQGAFTVENTNNGANSVAVTVTNGFSTTGNLVITDTDTTVEPVSLNIGSGASALLVGGTTTITAGADAGASTATLGLAGASNTFTQSVGVNGGANAQATAVINLTGAAAAFNGGLVLTPGVAGSAGLNVTGTTAQTVGGTITGTGLIQVDNTSATGATFSGTVAAGGITIDKGAGNSTATFQNTVAAPITLGHAATTVNGVTFGTVTAGDTNTAIFDSTNGNFGVTGAIAGANSTQTNNIDVIGGHIVTLNTASTSNLNTLSVTGNNTNFTMGAAVTVANTSIGAGATVTTGAFNLGSIIDGAATGGVGTLAVTGSSTVSGSIGGTNPLAAVTVATTDLLTVQGAKFEATTTTLTGTGALTLSNATTTVASNFASSDTLNTTTITTGTGAVTETGTIGTSGNQIGTLALGAGGSLTTAGNIYAGNAAGITAGSNTTNLILDGTTAQTVSGAYNTGILTVGSGGSASNVTFASALGAGTGLASVNVHAGAAATFDGAVTSLGALNVNGTATFTAGTSAFAGTLVNAGTLALGYVSGAVVGSQPVVGVATTTATDGAYSIGVTENANKLVSGKITSAGSLSLSNTTGSTIAVNVDPAAGAIANDSVTLIASGSGAVTKSFNAASDATLHAVTSSNSALYTFDYVRGDYAGGGTIGTNINTLLGNNTSSNDIVLVAVQNAITSLGSTITANDSSVYTALQAIGNTGGTQLTTFQGTLASASTAAAVHSLLQSVTPTVDGGSQAAALSVGADTQDIANTRLASLRDGDTKSGVAAGATANGVSMWVEGYGQHANQKLDDGVDGYSSNTWGGAVGVDTTTLLDKAILGVALNYGHSKIDSDNVNTTTTDMGNYGINLYGTYDLGDKMFVNGQAGYAYNKIDSDRHNVGGAGGPTATGDTNSDEYLARADLGRNYPMANDLTLTPDVSAAYTYLHTAGYTESGAPGLNQIVDASNLSSLGLGLGGTASWKIKDADDNIFKPALHVGYTYEAVNDRVQTTSAFAGDPGVSFVSDGASPARNVFDAGAKLIYSTTANWDVSAAYDFQIKQDYTSHTGEVRATAHF